MTQLTYPEVGRTRETELLPRDAHALRRRTRVGAAEVFDAAANFVLRYEMQRAAGFTVSATSSRATEGAEVTMRARFGPLRIVAPTRVVYVIDEPDRQGFAYGTLPGHPESGEELFLVERLGNETWVEIRAFSRPGRWYTRLGGPVVRRVQHRTTVKYLESVRAAVAPPDMHM